MAETTLKPCAFAFIVSDFQHVLRYPASVTLVFSAVNIRQTSCQDSARLWLPGGEVGTRSVYTVSLAPFILNAMECCVGVGE